VIGRVAVLALLAAVALRADEPAPAGEDAIAKAKRDYEAIKAAKAGGEQPAAAGLPRQDTASFDLHLTADLPAPSTSADAKKKDLANPLAGKKSANWLLDAMSEAKKGEHKDAKDRSMPGETEDERLTEKTDLLGQNRALADEKQKAGAAHAENASGAAEKRHTVEAPNPLTRYMATWMTPKDFALLNPKAATMGALPAAGNGALPSPSDAASPGGGEAGAWPGTSGIAEAFASSPGPALPAQAPKPNPYLAEFTLPAPPPGATRPNAPAAAPNTGAAVPAAFMPSAPPQQPPAKVSPLLEQVQKAQDDAKYLKQLKRF